MKKLLGVFITIVLMISLFPHTGVEGAAKKRFNMTYLFAASATDPIKYINMTNESLDQVSPRYFQVLDNGTMDVHMPANSRAFIEEMHKRNIEVVPFLANNWAKGELMFTNSEKITDQIVKTIKDYKLDGINIDVEGLGPIYRSQFTEFIQMLDKKLPNDKILSIAVAPNPWGTNKGWQGFYDYEALAECVDFLFIMTYDERGGGSKNNGPVASYSFIEKSVQYALKHVSPEKIVLGIPFYGRVWNLKDVSNPNDSQDGNSQIILGESISLNKVEELMDAFDVKIEYNKESESVKGTFEVKQGEPGFKLKSWLQPLKPGTYEMWIENESSIKKKLELVHKYNLKGVGSWSLGQEDPALWQDFRLWLDGLEFSDVGINHWALKSIEFVKERKWMLGKNTVTTFKPEDSLTRAEAAAILSRVLGLTYIEPANTPFTDIAGQQWASENIEIVRQHGIMKGTGVTTFEPGKALTREEMAAILDRLLADKYANNIPKKIMFTDQNQISSWAYDSIIRMSGNYVFSGYDDGTFKPKKNINRAEMAALLSRMADKFPE
ncbi:glycosyl hydrolase family 18 protein [Calidifontibacillus oryziterrae]|uniref:glycosyl hydrolase family 18 protein n=1 Tax=Calidifontibacillus oryziterrae TaxID=1191699 RepID=UPI0002EE8122|nr:glycosyl hydrolase family 18 protein [Calidifontibacillus oryziterrae]